MFFARGGALDARRDWAPMLDLLWAATNEGTGRRAALRVPTFGKTGTTQGNRDALFIGFAGNLVVGVWVGRDDNKSLGEVTGGTTPGADLADVHGPRAGDRRSRGPDLPMQFRVPAPARRERQSPLPDDWSKGTRAIRDLFEQIGELIEKQ